MPANAQTDEADAAAGLTVCATCDAVWRDVTPGVGDRVRCPRCHSVMRTARPFAIDRLLAFAIATPPLMAIALAGSFLTLSGGGAKREASVLDAAAAVATADTWLLAVAVGLAIIALPVLRAILLAYVLLPIRLGRPAARHAARAFRLAIELRPWAMAEIFLIGVAVALVKITGLAAVSLGPAFWAFAALAVLALMDDAALCRRSVWDLIA